MKVGIQYRPLTYWGRDTRICVSKLVIVGSDHGVSPGGCQASAWTNAGILLIRPLGTNFSEIFKKIHNIITPIISSGDKCWWGVIPILSNK